MGVGACKARSSRGPNTEMTQAQADRYIRKAVMKSSEGVVFFPAAKTGYDYDRVRLNEIAQSMRQPLAVCFLDRAISTMERGEVDGETTYLKVPEGQGKFRARINSAGEVLRAEVLESGFKDEQMEACVLRVIESKTFPQLRGQSQSHVDIVYWVSLGMHAGAQTPQFARLLRKQQALAGVRAKKCLEGRVEAGVYEVEGLSLFGRTGGTLVNRITHGDLPTEVSQCVAQAFKSIMVDPEDDSFVRPASPVVTFTMREDGVVTVSDERWLQVTEMEERAKREEQRRELQGGEAPPPSEPLPASGAHDVTISGLEPVVDEDPPDSRPAPEPAPLPEPTPAPEPEDPRQDPSQRGIKLDLGPRG